MIDVIFEIVKIFFYFIIVKILCFGGTKSLKLGKMAIFRTVFRITLPITF